ncbi:MAG TPA: cupredoxin domain-containing protein [Acidimicrobiia bacterium]|jgi:plastocyanin
MGKFASAAAALIAGILVLGACGSSSSGSKSTSTTASGSSAPVQLTGKLTNKGVKDVTGTTTVSLEADDYYFEPTFVKATPGSSLTIQLKNEGKQVHTFTIDGVVDQMVNPDQTKTIQVTVPQNGAFNFYCRFHRSRGMQGAIFTANGQTIAAASGAGLSGAPGGAATTAPTPTTTATTSSSSSGSGSGYGY